MKKIMNLFLLIIICLPLLGQLYPIPPSNVYGNTTTATTTPNQFNNSVETTYRNEYGVTTTATTKTNQFNNTLETTYRNEKGETSTSTTKTNPFNNSVETT